MVHTLRSHVCVIIVARARGEEINFLNFEKDPVSICIDSSLYDDSLGWNATTLENSTERDGATSTSFSTDTC